METWVPSPESKRNRSPSRRTNTDVRNLPGRGIIPLVPIWNASRFTMRFYNLITSGATTAEGYAPRPDGFSLLRNMDTDTDETASMRASIAMRGSGGMLTLNDVT